ncbi:MAG: hypothetical protein ACNI27_07380 [Desulfovibrio sp.]
MAGMVRRWLHRKEYSRFKRLFSTVDGRAVLIDLMKITGFCQSSFVQGDPHSTAFRDGQKSVFLAIQARLEAGEDEILELVQEYQQAE